MDLPKSHRLPDELGMGVGWHPGGVRGQRRPPAIGSCLRSTHAKHAIRSGKPSRHATAGLPRGPGRRHLPISPGTTHAHSHGLLPGAYRFVFLGWVVWMERVDGNGILGHDQQHVRTGRQRLCQSRRTHRWFPSGTTAGPGKPCNSSNLGQRYLTYAACTPWTGSTCSGGSSIGYECASTGGRMPFLGAPTSAAWSDLTSQGIQDINRKAAGNVPYPAYGTYECSIP